MGMRHFRSRVVLVTRKTPLELLVERYGTRRQAAFDVRSRGQDVRWQEEMHERFHSGLNAVIEAIPPDRHRARVDRDELDRFLFAPDDLVLMVGQDGLVPNTAKYLDGQLAVGINPDPAHYDGILCAHGPEAAGELVAWSEKQNSPHYRIERRVMAEARREDGQKLLALNEVFIGHRSHQSARYRIWFDRREERQSSSGVIVSTGTGSTGWARSISLQRQLDTPLPGVEERRLACLVREPWPSVATGAELTFELIGPEQELVIVSEMGEGGVVFADGIESDRIEFLDGQTLRVRVASQTLNLVMPAIHPVA
jgi:NAD kinase